MIGHKAPLDAVRSSVPELEPLDLTPWPEEDAARYRALGVWRDESLVRILDRSAADFPERIAVIDGVRRVTYGELLARVDSLSAGLLERGLGWGDKVVVQLPNVLEAIEVYFALFRLGAVPVLALPGHREAELDAFFAQTGASSFVTMGEIEGFELRALAADLGKRHGLRHLFLAGDAGELTPLSEVSGKRREFPSPSASSLALLQLSGGSTATPKLIPRTHADYAYSIRRSVEVCALSPETRLLAALPLAHNFTMSSPGFLGCLLAGGTVVLTQDPTPDSVLPLLFEQEINIVPAVPPLAMRWLQALLAQNLRFPAGCLLQVGGAKLSPSDAEALYAATNGRLQQVFGMAEGLVCYTPLDAPRAEIVSTQGRPMSPLDEVLVVDDADRPVAPGEAGHLLTRGPYTIRGYYRAPLHNRAAFTSDGFYRTGDVARQTSSGALLVVGRAKEQINRGGEKIAPAELERFLSEHPAVLSVAVLGRRDEDLGERTCAVAERTSKPQGQRTKASEAQRAKGQEEERSVHQGPDRAELNRHLTACGLSASKLLDELHWVSSMPRTAVGKLDKKGLLTWLESQERAAQQSGVRARESSPRPDQGRSGDALLGALAELLRVEPGELTEDANLLELGLDSLRIMTLVERFRGFGVETSFMEIAEDPSVRGLRALLDRAEDED